MNEHLCYPEDVEEQVEQAERFQIDPEWSIGRCFRELDNWKAGQLFPSMSDEERAKISPMAMQKPVQSGSMFCPVPGAGMLAS